MRNRSNIFIFFIVLALLFWNPISYYLFYGKASFYHSSVLHFIFWLSPIVGIGFIFLIKKNKISQKTKNLIFSLSFLLFFYGFLVILNSAIGFFIKLDNEFITSGTYFKKGLIFEPNSIARYSTVEFDFTAEINSLGLRDREMVIDKGNQFRVLCFGDSWTMGWGVELEHSWPKQLEKILHSQGYKNIEVINCGKDDAYTTLYKKYMSEAVPLLKPDLVLVGILQLDDLAQLYENNFFIDNFYKQSKSISLLDVVKSIYNTKDFIRESFNNIIYIARNIAKEDIIEIKENWKRSSNRQIQEFNHLQILRFNTLDETVQNLFKTGNLNPAILYYDINFPDRLAIFNNPNHLATIFALKEMDRDVNEMKNICQENEAELVFINLPDSIFTGHNVVCNSLDILNSYFLENNNIDLMYKSIASSNELQYIELTERFIELKDKKAYFYTYDGHPNENGYREIAKLIGEKLIIMDIIKEEK